MNHGIYIKEAPSTISTVNRIENITVAIGTAPLANAQPVLCYSYSDFEKSLGYDETFTLSEVAQACLNLYSVAPIAFINVFNPEKHFKTVFNEIEDETEFLIEDEIIDGSLKVTSGEKILPTILVKDTDYACGSMYLHGQDNPPVIAIEFLNLDKIQDGKFKVTYRKTSTALGGDPVVEEVLVDELEENIWELTDDTIPESVVVETGGVDTFVELEYTLAQDVNGANLITINNPNAIVDNKIDAEYQTPAPESVTIDDVIAGVELVDSIYPKYNVLPSILIAPGFSTDIAVATALARKAKSVSDAFQGVAVADISSETCPTVQDAIAFKNENNLSDTNLILCYPKVLSEGKQYFLSTHLAALMNRTDFNNGNIPFVSPSNQSLEISASILADGTEIYFNQGKANALNAAGIVTVFAFGNALKAWGNCTSIFPSSSDVKDIYIPVRRMFNFISAYLLNNYVGKVDVPITKRNIDSILQSANLWLASLTSRQVLLGGELEFNEANNSISDLMAGRVAFDLRICPPIPAQELSFTLTFDATYYSALFA